MTGQNLNKEIIDSWCVHVYEVLQQLNTIFFLQIFETWQP